MKQDSTPTPSDEERAEKIIARAVRRKLGMFAAFRDLSKDDLIAEMLIQVRRAWHNYDPSKSAFSTFVYVVASRRLLDLYDKRACELEKLTLAAKHDWVRDVQLDDEADELAERSPLDWIREIRIRLRRHVPNPKRRGGRSWFHRHQLLAAGLLMERMKLSVRGAQVLVTASALYRSALGLRHAPSRDWWHRAQRAARSFRTQKRKMIEQLCTGNVSVRQ